MNCMTCGKLFLEEGIKVHCNSCIEVLVDTAWMYLLLIWIISFLNIMIFCAIPKCVVLCLVNHKQAKYRMVHLQGNCCFKMPCFSSKPFEAITSWHHWVIDSLLPLQFSCLFESWKEIWNVKQHHAFILLQYCYVYVNKGPEHYVTLFRIWIWKI